MLSGFKIVVALLVIVAVATILISPDPTDDVPGILHSHLKLQKVASVFYEPLSTGSGLVASVLLAALRASSFSSSDVVALTCVRLC